jgi:hypothetical protein
MQIGVRIYYNIDILGLLISKGNGNKIPMSILY